MKPPANLFQKLPQKLPQKLTQNLYSSLYSKMTLALWTLVLYIPFLGERGIRMAGDEKVYISQAIEMARAGNWFVQTLHDVPDYYKGPFHFILLRIGMLIFGPSLWAGLYMNLLFVLLGALCIFDLIEKHFTEHKYENAKEIAFWAGGLFTCSLGIYTHSFASQMEVELAGSFALGLWCLNRMTVQSAGWAFWCIAGIVGWIKSPLHSVFLGCGGILFWILNGEILARIKNPKTWGAALLGVAFGVLGYLPASLLDPENFLGRYLMKETYNKSSSGQGVLVTLTSTFGFYLFPWLVFAASAYFKVLTPAFWRSLHSKDKRLIKLCLAFCVPSVAFFMYHPYRFENYNIPVIAAPIVFLALSLHFSSRTWDRFHRVSLSLFAILFFALAGIVYGIQMVFQPDPSWWSPWVGIGGVAGFLGTAIFWVRYGVLPEKPSYGALTLSNIGLYWAIGLISTAVGEREMLDVRNYLAENPNTHLTYYNPKQNIWNEWGILNLALHRDVHGLHTPNAAISALKDGDTILVPGQELLDDLTALSKTIEPVITLKVIPWKRWRTRGQSNDGKPLWKTTFENKDLTLLERDFFIVVPERTP